MTHSRSPEPSPNADHDLRLHSTAQMITWLPEIEVPIEETLSRAAEERLGRRVRRGLSRLRRLLSAHPATCRRHVTELARVAAGETWLFAWIPRKRELPGDYERIAGALGRAARLSKSNADSAHRSLDKVRSLLALYPLEPETVCREARWLIEQPREGDELDALVDGTRITELCRRLVDEIEEVKSHLVVCNLRLVLKNVLEYRPQGQSRSDLYQEGIIGLQRAVFRFNPEHGVRFATYATHWIRQGIRKAIKDSSRVIRVPVGVQEKSMRNDGSLAPLELARVRRLLNQTVFLYANESDDGENPLLNLLSTEKSAYRDEALHVHSIPGAIEAAISRLPERERFILEHRFGLNGADERTLEECGEALSLSRERVRQIEVVALERLRQLQQLEELWEDLVAS